MHSCGFGTGGRTSGPNQVYNVLLFPYFVRSIAQADDGSFYVIGTDQLLGADIYANRYTASGTWDAAFGRRSLTGAGAQIMVGRSRRPGAIAGS